MKIVQFKKVTKTYTAGDHVQNALSDVDLELDDGRFVVILGPSGAGKSTLVNIISNRLFATSGSVYIDGEPIAEDYINDLTYNKLDFIGPKTVPEGCVFVMGDNRNASTDSRDKRIGMVDKRLVIGKVLLVVYPFNSFGSVE